jgi:hypothetical protein
MLALAQGESAQALAALGDKPQAREVAAAALKSWQPQPADPGPPPLLQPWLVPVRALAAH